jgi:hypothetical protein
MRQKRRFKMNVVTVEKIAFQVADSALIVGAFLAQVAVRHGEKLSAMLQDQAAQDLQLTRDRLMFDAYTLMHEPEALADDFRNTAYDALAYVFQALILLPDFYYFMIEALDHEIPISLEAELKPMNVVQSQQLLLPAPAIAGLLPPASEPVAVAGILGTPVIIEPQVVELPADWNLDKNGRKLSGAALQARMRKYNLATASTAR